MAASVSDTIPAAHQPDLQHIKILLGDDDPQAGALIEMSLSGATFEHTLEVVPTADLEDAVGRVIDDLARLSPLALAMAKRVLNQAYEGPLAQGLELEGLAYGLLQQSHDFREGVEAFTEKRTPEEIERLVAVLAS